MRLNTFKISFLLLGIWMSVHYSTAQAPKTNVLVFSKTAAFRHESIGAGKVALAKMAKEKVFEVTFTEEAARFADADLKNYIVKKYSGRKIFYQQANVILPEENITLENLLNKIFHAKS